MNSKLTHTITFLIGAALGGLAAWKYAREKYEAIADEEIRSVKETFSRREPAVASSSTVETSEHSGESVLSYAEMLRGEGYLPEETGRKEGSAIVNDKPYVISPEEFGELEGYERISLTYYADGILTDENDEEVDDIDEIVGTGSLKHFGEYEEDSVFVRNDRLKCDYEILLDQRPYADALKAKPYLHREG